MFQIVIFRLLFALTLGLLPLDVFAHTGVGQTTGFLAGFGHPMGGADHLLTMFAVGLWAAQTGGRAVWAIPAVFVGLMVCGGILGVSGIFLPFVELSILTSVLILGLMTAGACKLPFVFGALIIGCFAIFHGYAHGAEMPSTVGAVLYSVGFILTTALLHVGGIICGLTMKALRKEKLTRLIGIAITLSGIYLAAYA